MAAERDLELLDDYLANRLNADEKAAFESKLASDPGLQSEMNMQQQLIGGIQKARIAELKTMMNNVPISAMHGGSAVATKAIVGVAVATVIGVGAYIWFNNLEESAQDVNPVPPQEEQSTVPAEPDTASESEDLTKPHEDSGVVPQGEHASEQKPTNVPNPIKKKKDSVAPSDPKIEVYDPTQEQNDQDASSPFEGAQQPQLKESSDVVVEIDSENKKYNFHYQFKAGKLFLYGPFQKDLYEILEFFNDGGRTMFLFYNDQYYFLKDNNEKLKSLTPVQNEDLIRKLNESRN